MRKKKWVWSESRSVRVNTDRRKNQGPQRQASKSRRYKLNSPKTTRRRNFHRNNPKLQKKERKAYKSRKPRSNPKPLTIPFIHQTQPAGSDEEEKTIAWYGKGKKTSPTPKRISRRKTRNRRKMELWAWKKR